MTQFWSRGWVRWLAGFVFGAALGWSFFVLGLLVVAIAGLALVLGIVGRWHVAFLSGSLSGIGAIWLWLMFLVMSNCSADPTCAVSSGTVGFIGTSLGFLLVGALIGVYAWRRQSRSL
jgi:hypothetical protein